MKRSKSNLPRQLERRDRLDTFNLYVLDPRNKVFFEEFIQILSVSVHKKQEKTKR